jgi:hypothetical protein
MDFADMRQNGVHSLDIYCLCGHRAVVNVDAQSRACGRQVGYRIVLLAAELYRNAIHGRTNKRESSDPV